MIGSQVFGRPIHGKGRSQIDKFSRKALLRRIAEGGLLNSLSGQPGLKADFAPHANGPWIRQAGDGAVGRAGRPLHFFKSGHLRS